jgi:hypothetical protein
MPLGQRRGNRNANLAAETAAINEPADVAPELPADTAPTVAAYGGKERLLTLDGVDKRTGAYRQTKQLITDIETDLGGPDQLSAAERQLVQHGAVLGAVLTDMEAKT